jgi:hypothetical protein
MASMGVLQLLKIDTLFDSKSKSVIDQATILAMQVIGNTDL